MKKKEHLYWLLLVLLTLPHFNPDFFNQCVPIAEKLINVWRILSFLAIFAWTLFKRKKVSLITALLVIQQSYVVVNTFFQKGDVFECIVVALSAISVVMLYDLMLDDEKLCYSSQLFCFELIIYVNLITAILFPKGMYAVVEEFDFVYPQNNFLGHYNSFTQFAIPALLVAFLYMHKTGRKIRTYLLTAAIYITAFIARSGGVLVSLAAMLVAYLLLKNFSKIFHYYSYWSIHIVYFVGIICLRLQDMFRWLIEGVLDKWFSLTDRIEMAHRTMQMLKNSLFFGYGHKAVIERKIEMGRLWGSAAHNLLVETVYQGGIINLILFVAIVVIAGQAVYRYRKSVESKIISIAFLGCCISTLVESALTPFLMAMFVIAYHSNRQERELDAVKYIDFSPALSIFRRKSANSGKEETLQEG